MLFDLMLKPVDSYWKKQFKAEAALRHRAEADAKYAEGMLSIREEELQKVSERDVKQHLALDAIAKRLKEQDVEISRLTERLGQREREIDALREALQSERDARNAMKLNAKLWESAKHAAAGQE